MMLNFPLIILVLTVKRFCNAKTLNDHANVISKADTWAVAQPARKYLRGQIFWLWASKTKSILLGTTSLKAQNDKNFRGHDPLGYAYACGRLAWSLQATWCLQAPRWWPLH